MPTTPARPDIESGVPALAAYRRTAVRLHPRHGDPGAYDSSIGGPVLLDRGEPWPTCAAAHRGEGPDWTYVDLSGVPEPMVSGAQLWRRDVPELPFHDDEDLCQVLWCPLFHEEPDTVPNVRLRWLATTRPGVAPAIGSAPPRSPYAARSEWVPAPCTVSPERVREYPVADDELPADLRDLADAWAQAHGLDYFFELGPAPGTKVNGWPRWNGSAPVFRCAAGHRMRAVLTVASREYDTLSQRAWQPVGEPSGDGQEDAGVTFADAGFLCVFVCGDCADRPTRCVIDH